MSTLTTALIVATVVAGSSASDAPALSSLAPMLVRSESPAIGALNSGPSVRVWLDGGSDLRHGESPELYFRTDDDAFVMVIRIDTDGRQEVLFPRHFDDEQRVRGRRTYRVTGDSRGSFVVDDDPGLGYVFAIASWGPFDLDEMALGRSGNYRYASARVYGDPFVAVQSLAERLLDRDALYSLDHVQYHVGGQRYDYPRFLCYECHGYRSYSRWDPYAHRCGTYRMVIYDDPYYYPYRHYGGSRVVYVREPRRPRYEFKPTVERDTRDDTPYIEHRRRPDAVDRRRPGSTAQDPNIPVRVHASS
ncbi:MAG: DUF4384 domain-containing protein, partial [Gemmatimonadota bacterium]|nr:DUF4384 domain-containing protein [Gemmatimonadota bacterium]